MSKAARMYCSEVPLVHGENALDLKPFRRRHNGCVGETQRQIAVLHDQFPATNHVLVKRCDEREGARFDAFQEFQRGIDAEARG